MQEKRINALVITDNELPIGVLKHARPFASRCGVSAQTRQDSWDLMLTV
jgi:hypothetical protein